LFDNSKIAAVQTAAVTSKQIIVFELTLLILADEF
jgi:hypothetical protein